MQNYRVELKMLIETTALSSPCQRRERLYYDRMSSLICHQLVKGYEDGRLHLNLVINELDYMEGLIKETSTKSPDKFRRPESPLKGFSKKHYFQFADMIGNIGAYWGLNFGGNEKFSKMIHEVFEQHPGEMLGENIIGKIVHKLTFDGYEKRCRRGKMTGNWIVFKEHNGKNYYLGMFPHSFDDEVIFSNMENHCKEEFPFLF